MMTNLNYDLPWSKLSFVVVDLEGTGAQHKEKEGIVEVAAITVNCKQITSNYFYSLINPEIEIPSIVSRIHGLKNKDVKDEPVFSLIEASLLSYIDNKILVGHNVNVDYRVLKLKMPHYAPALILDTKKISAHFWQQERKHGLDDLIDRFQLKSSLEDLPIKRKRHSAFYDAYATSLLFIKMLEEKMSDTAPLSELARIGGLVKPDDNKNVQPSLF